MNDEQGKASGRINESTPAFLSFVLLVGMVVILTLTIASERESHKFFKPINLRTVDCNYELKKLFLIRTKCYFDNNNSAKASCRKKLMRGGHSTYNRIMKMEKPLNSKRCSQMKNDPLYLT